MAEAQQPNWNQFDKSDSFTRGGGQQHQQRKADTRSSGDQRFRREPTKVNVFVTNVETPTLLWAQVVTPESTAEMVQLVQDIEKVCPTSPPVIQADSQKVYATKFTEDQAWYRCKISQFLQDKFLPDKKVRVLFIDYGNSEDKYLNELVELPPELSRIRGFAQYFCLYGIKPCFEDPDTAGFYQGKQCLTQLTADKELVGKIYPKYSDKVPFQPISLEDESQPEGQRDINLRMHQAGFGKLRYQQAKDGDDSNRHNNRQGQWKREGFGAGSTDTSKDQKFTKNSFNSPYKKVNPTNSSPSLNVQHKQTSSLFTNSQPAVTAKQPPPSLMQLPNPGFGNYNRSNQGELGVGFKSNQQQSTNNSPLVAKQQSYDSFSAPAAAANFRGKDVMERELQQAKMKQKQLESELESIKGRLAAQEKKEKSAVTAIQGEKASALRTIQSLRDELSSQEINKRLCELKNCLAKVKKLRKQFPSNNEYPDYIQEAISLLLDDSGSRIATDQGATRKVDAACKAYKESQEEIKNCTEKGLLPDMTEKRDALRKDLYHSIEEFGASVASLPLDERSDSIRTAIQHIEECYSAFLIDSSTKKLTLEEAVEKYRDWKKKVNFDTIRNKTNSDHHELDNAMVLLRQQFGMDLKQTAAVDHPVDFDSLLILVTNDMKAEISNTDVEKLPDAVFIRVLISTLIGTLQRELTNIRALCDSVTSYNKEKQSLEYWLEEKPDLSQIKEQMFKVKKLKSQLRHKLADKEDLEQEVATGHEDLEKINKDLEDIRYELHNAIMHQESATEKNQRYLALLAEQHFPEIILQNPDLGLEVSLKYSGLVKSSLDIDQYTTQCISEDPSVYTAKFCDTDVVLKEYFVEGSKGMASEEFLDRALDFYSINSPSLLPINAIFYSKVNKMTYMETPLYTSLGSMSVDEILAMSDTEKMLTIKGVLEGLQALHEKNLHHGGVHPNNVFVNAQANGKSVLSEYNLCGVRKKIYKTKANLSFKPPGSEDTMQVKATDMYCAGLVMVYLIAPNCSSESLEAVKKNNNAPPGLKAIIDNLLGESVGCRNTATEVLTSEYFQETQEQTVDTTAISSPVDIPDRDNEAAASNDSLFQDTDNTDAGSGDDHSNALAEALSRAAALSVLPTDSTTDVTDDIQPDHETSATSETTETSETPKAPQVDVVTINENVQELILQDNLSVEDLRDMMKQYQERKKSKTPSPPPQED